MDCPVAAGSTPITPAPPKVWPLVEPLGVPVPVVLLPVPVLVPVLVPVVPLVEPVVEAVPFVESVPPAVLPNALPDPLAEPVLPNVEPEPEDPKLEPPKDEPPNEDPEFEPPEVEEPNPEEFAPPFMPDEPLGPTPAIGVAPPPAPVSGWPKNPIAMGALFWPNAIGFQSSLPVMGSVYFFLRNRMLFVFTSALMLGGYDPNLR